jgi:hypothetical protein
VKWSHGGTWPLLPGSAPRAEIAMAKGVMQMTLLQTQHVFPMAEVRKNG